MGQKYILDTNTIIDYIGNKLPEVASIAIDNIVNEEFNTSIVVKIETLGFDGEEGEMQQLSDFLMLAKIFYIDEVIAEKTIELRKKYRKLKLGDALIGATAILNKFGVITRNVADFRNIGIEVVINPYDLQ